MRRVTMRGDMQRRVRVRTRPAWTMMLVAGIAALAASGDAGAQVGRFPRQSAAAESPYWVGLSYGYVDAMTVNDGTTGGVWGFGYTSQIRATLEKTLARGASIGLAASFATPTLTYENPSSPNACGLSCTATADVTQYTAFVTGGGGVGFHGFYTLEGGVTEFSNFRERDTNTPLPPTSANYDFTFGFGGGFGYGFSPTMDIYAGEMLDFVLHPQGSSVGTSAPRVTTFRAGFRVGF